MRQVKVGPTVLRTMAAPEKLYQVTRTVLAAEGQLFKVSPTVGTVAVVKLHWTMELTVTPVQAKVPVDPAAFAVLVVQGAALARA
jgi:hypothetical protein